VAALAAGTRLTLEALGQAWIAAAGGAPKTVQQHERWLKFALDHLRGWVRLASRLETS
jgi:hypothetical protein